MRDAALQRAIDHLGGVTKTALALGVSVPAVSQWLRCPVSRALDLERAVGGVVTCHDLRPDKFPARPRPRRAA